MDSSGRTKTIKPFTEACGESVESLQDAWSRDVVVEASGVVSTASTKASVVSDPRPLE